MSTNVNNYFEKVKYFQSLLANRQVKNIIFSLIFRFAAIASNFLIVPLLINNFSQTKYGILITIVSISSWFSFIDFGLANGLKNKISESLMEGDTQNVRKYISTAYLTMLKVSFCLAAILLIIDHFVNWNTIIKAPIEDETSVNILFLYGLLIFFAKILVELINSVLLAFHKTAISSFITFASQLMILCICYFYKLFNDKSLLHFGLVFFWAPFVTVLAASIYFYSTSYSNISPSLNFLEKKYQKSLLNLGGSFFVIQIAVLIVFTTDNLIVGRIFGYSEVSNYNIAFRYFNVPVLVFSIILTPYWPVFAEWFIVKNMDGVKKIMKRLLIVWIGLSLLSLGMLMIAPAIYKLWIGPNVKVPFMLNLGMSLFAIITCWNNVYVTFINGTNKLRLQLWNCIFAGIINIPLSIYLSKNTFLGSSGVIFSTCICLAICSIWAPIQYYKLVYSKAEGIWNK